MTRKKLKLAYITKDSSRKATYKKRKKGLLKKMDELTTLCGVDGCAIIYGPYEDKPVVWPSTPQVRQILSKFKRLPAMEQYKKMMTQEEFLSQRVAKAHEQLEKLQRHNREKEMNNVMFQCLINWQLLQTMKLMDLFDLMYVIDENLNAINKRLDTLRHNEDQNTNLVQPKLSAGGATLDGHNMVGVHVYPTPRQVSFTDMMTSHENYDWHTSDFSSIGTEKMIVPFGDHEPITGETWSSAFLK